MADPVQQATQEDPVIMQTVQGGNAANVKTYFHAMDLLCQKLIGGLIEDSEQNRVLARAVTTRCVNSVLGRQISDAASDAVAANEGLDANQIGAKVAQSTPPQTGDFAFYQAALNALQQSQTQNTMMIIDAIGKLKAA